LVGEGEGGKRRLAPPLNFPVFVGAKVARTPNIFGVKGAEPLKK